MDPIIPFSKGILRRIKTEDLKALFSLVDSDIIEMYYADTEDFDYDRFRKDFLPAEFDIGNDYVIENSDNELIGVIRGGVTFPSESILELATFVGANYRREGYAKDALITYTYNYLKYKPRVKTICAIIANNNEKARTGLESSGFMFHTTAKVFGTSKEVFDYRISREFFLENLAPELIQN